MASGRDGYPEFDKQVQLGWVPGVRILNKFGYNPDVDSGHEDVWDAGGIKVWPSAAGVVTVVSTDVDDTDGGAGANTIVVQGLDANWEEVQETFTMNGQTNVVGAVEFLRVHRMWVVTAGATGLNEGTITATLGGNPQAAMIADHGQSEQAIYTVPAGHKLLVTDFHVEFGKETSGDQAIVLAQWRNVPDGQTSWRSATGICLYQGSGHFKGARVFPEKTDIRIHIDSDFTNLEVSASFRGYLMTNAYEDIR